MSNRDAYLFYEAGQAVAAAYLGLTIRRISADPVLGPTEILFPRKNPKPQMIAWLTGMAAEKKGVGRGDQLRRTRNRKRMHALHDALMAELRGESAKRRAASRRMLIQAQDRGSAICNNFFEAIQKVVRRLRANDFVTGPEVEAIV